MRLTWTSHKLSANLNNLSQHLVHLHSRFCEKSGLTTEITEYTEIRMQFHFSVFSVLSVVIFLFLCSASKMYGEETWQSKSEGISLQVSLSDTNVEVGDPLKIHLSLFAPEGYQIDSDTLKKQILDAVNTPVSQIELNMEKFSERELIFHLRPLTPGVFFLNFITIPIIYQGNTLYLLGKATPIEVLLGLSEEREAVKFLSGIITPRDYGSIEISAQNGWRWVRGEEKLKQIAEQNASLFPNYRLIFGVSILLLFISTAIYLYRESIYRFFRNFLFPQKDPKDLALEAVDRLKRTRSVKVPETADIVRRYLSSKTQLPFQTMTTSEVLYSLKTKEKYPTESLQLAKEIFRYSDLVKFANYQPKPEKKEEILAKTDQFIRG